MADLRTTVNGLVLPNPFIIGSGPPGTNANVIGKAFDEGWGAVIAKTISLDASKVINVAPRYARLRTEQSKEIYGWQNIELISDRPFDEDSRELHALPPRLACVPPALSRRAAGAPTSATRAPPPPRSERAAPTGNSRCSRRGGRRPGGPGRPRGPRGGSRGRP